MIYKITYPNGKIYIGQDRTDDINYYGSADSHSIAEDFSEEERRVFVIRKEIICRLHNVTIGELNAVERLEIARQRSTDPAIGYNRTGQRRRIRTTCFAEGDTA